jgi:hypothetical protein
MVACFSFQKLFILTEKKELPKQVEQLLFYLKTNKSIFSSPHIPLPTAPLVAA